MAITEERKKYMDYLSWASYKLGLNKTEIIKRALDRDIDEDKEFGTGGTS